MEKVYFSFRPARIYTLREYFLNSGENEDKFLQAKIGTEGENFYISELPPQ